ncbi:MAG: mandelate racemase/muconate lactonizing enzyme family protein [Planctomycetaceae bacterium]
MSSRFDRRGLLRTAAILTAGGAAATATASLDDEKTDAARKCTIKSVQTFLLRHTLERPFGVSVSVPLDKTRETLLVRMESNEGHVGWGETSPLPGTKAAIDELGLSLIGQSPLQYRRLWRSLWGANFGNALAVAGLDMALNDLRGKVLNLSVAELFGGRLRDKVPAYASAMNYLEGMEPETHYPLEAATLVKQGFRALKMRIGRFSVAREAKLVAAVRDVVGPDVLLMADGNAAYTMESAVRMGHILNDQKFECFEEPMPQSPKYAAYEDLRNRLPLSLAAGEALDSRASAKELIDRRAMDIIQPDISLCGGFAETLFIAEMAALSGIRCIPHCWGADILIAATVQLLSILPDPHWGFPTDTPLLELDQSENPWRNGLAKDAFPLTDGMIHVPTGPGLGINIDEMMVKEYSV